MPEQLTIQTARPSDSVTFTILSDSVALPSTISVQSIEVWQEVNRITRARIIILDGSPSDQTFSISESDNFIPGKEIEIQAGYHSEEESIFKGLVTKHSIKVRDSGKSHLIVECAHPSVKMTKLRKSKFFYDVKDSDVWSEIIQSYEINSEIEETSFTHHQLLQYEASDWDYLISRAESFGLFVVGQKDKLVIAPPDFDQEITQAVNYGSTLLSLDAEIDSATQVSSAKGNTWDYSKTEITEIEARNSNPVTPGNLTIDELSEVLKSTELILRDNAKQPDELLQKWTDSTLLRHQLAKVRGRARFQGIPEMQAGKIIELQGLGDRFNGKAFVSGVKHEIIHGNWHIDVQFGLNHVPFAEKFNIHSPKAAALHPAVNGLQIGVVTQLSDDPENDYRILVNIPLMNKDDQGLWARFATSGAGENRGVFIHPEIGDEVLLGFINDDPNHPVILGSFNSNNFTSPNPPNDDNHKKGWVTRSEIEFFVDDEKKSVEVKLPSGKSLFLSDDEDEIILKDDHNNSISMNSDGITLESGKDIILKTASGDISFEAKNLKAKAQMEAKIEGASAAELSASGTTTIKGALVQIN